MKQQTEKFIYSGENDFRNLYGNIVAEKRSVYNSSKFLTPYFEREDLSSKEKVCIGNYQDFLSRNLQKNDWNFEIPENWMQKSWCYVINSYCRDEKFKEKMTPFEINLVEETIQGIDSAIEKSKTDKEYILYRGVSDLRWLSRPYEGETFCEKAFGSFSSDIEQIQNYINPKNSIIFQLELLPNTNVLYLDSHEKEFLRPRNKTYEITKIEKRFIQVKQTDKVETIVYRITEKED
ncbi:hypothetical protein MmiAt1_14380 [Methanimicrococcus sp. At1]|uniref:ADP ribosyltransferase domain-containing protein n=1 Tax=Methanimicrococcus hacksteinii TaxID=3028293 RepID=A0ABU3VR10_9EURY|nr:ADP-ribosyltransferase [Methanimicrococcus sp. At1]MDV0445838.1 hypothetical protein [Methanimicrococcus sp. At1]